MTFLNTIMLGGLAAIAIPILIHLLNRRRFRKVMWAAMRFIAASVEKNKRRMEIEDLILLALRCLIVALIALALARPTLRNVTAGFLGGGRTAGILLLDNSLSMGMSDGTSTRFDKAKRAAEQAIDSLPQGSSVAVWLVSDIVRDVIPEPTFDLNLARKSVREAALSDRATELAAAIDRGVETLLKRVGSRREIYLFTDGQLEGWRGLLDIKSRLDKVRDQVRAHVVLISEKDQKNISVRDLRLASGLAPAGQSLRFDIQVQNHGSQPVSNVRVSIASGTERSSDEFTIASLAPGESKGVGLHLKLREPGIHAVVASAGEDRLAADNQRTLAVRALRQLKVLIVDGSPPGDSQSRETFFLRHALNPVPASELESYFIKVQTVPGLEMSSVALEDHDVIIMANVSRIPERLTPTVADFVRRGGGLLFFPGDQIDAAFYNEQWVQKVPLLPAALGTLQGQESGSDQFFPLQSKDFSHPITALWNDPAAGTLSGVRIYRYHSLKPDGATNGVAGAGTPGSLPRTILAFADGTPALMERPYGLGRVAMFCSTADTDWCDLAVRPAFVPLLHRLLGALIARQDEGLNLRVGGRFSINTPPDLAGREAAFTRPMQSEGTRDMRRIDPGNGTPVLEYDRTDHAGFYSAEVSEPAFRTGFATQAEPSESNLEELSAEQLAALRSTVELYTWSPQFSLKQLVESQRSGVEFWPTVLACGLMLAAVECFLAQWFSRSR